MIEAIKGLSESQIEQIGKATEDILENVGFQVMHPEVLRRARGAGAKVDEASGRVRLPAALLRERLAQVPSCYRIVGLDGTEYEVGGDSRHWLGIVTDPWIIDYETQKPRRPRLADIRRHTRIAQQLEQVVAISLMDFPVTDFEGPTSSLHAREEYLLNHAKHIMVVASSTEDFHRWLEIGGLLLQGKDLANSKLMSAAVAVVSPLKLTEANAEHLLMACEHNFPVIPTVCPTAGMTSPYSLASTLLQENAEAIFIAALTQIVKPGHPFLYAVGPSVGDMRMGHARYYSMDKVLWKIAAGQLGRSYGFPTTAECGGTLNYRYDPQNGAEGVLFMLAAYASKSNMLAGIGSCYNAIGMSAEMMLIHTAWLEVAKFLGRGINTDEEHLGVESIKKAGPGGTFLTDDLTLKFLRSEEFFRSDLFDLTCEFGEGEPLLVRAHNKVEALLARYQSPLPEKIQEDIRRYFADLYQRLES